MDAKVDTLVLPGDVLGAVPESVGEIGLGSGLMQQEKQIVATKGGILRFRAPNKYWVENYQKRVGSCPNNVTHGASMSLNWMTW